MVQIVPRVVEVPQVQVIDKVVDVPVVKQRQVPIIQAAAPALSSVNYHRGQKQYMHD